VDCMVQMSVIVDADVEKDPLLGSYHIVTVVLVAVELLAAPTVDYSRSLPYPY
jgi:hypothetical protein